MLVPLVSGFSFPPYSYTRLSGRGRGSFTIALFRLTRCVAGLKGKLVKTNFPFVHGHTLVSARSARAPTSLPRMPQTNKCRNTQPSDAPGSFQVGSSAQDPGPVSRDVSLAAGDAGVGGGVEVNVGDREIIKSPSDPKEYR